ncbi:MAG: hypothetical protein COA50_08695 [Flavobacteriaceae bacterium]|nr:MAG: hypothetical protein COA50_08695 [Flavobacteriaceae bacterium]
MKDIDPIYSNGFGIAFQWKKGTSVHDEKIQMVFRDTGLLLSKKELLLFAKNIECTKNAHGLCGQCLKSDRDCRALLLDTPAPQVTMAVSQNELSAIQDLVEGTLFNMNLDKLIGGICNDN